MQQKQLSNFLCCFASLWWGVVGTIFQIRVFRLFIELTVHRTIWTAIYWFCTSFYKKWPEFIKIIQIKKNRITFLSGLLVNINWELGFMRLV